jgi:hypothetical protein
MRRKIVGFFTFVAVAVGVAVGVYFASQISDGRTAAQEQAEKPTLTPAAVVVEEPGLEEDEPAVVPTAASPISLTPEPAVTALPSLPTPPPHPPTPTATPTPTPVPEPGVCPAPKRMTPADLAKPPPVLPASEIPGQRVQGGVPYSEAYVTVQLPAGREFIIASAWSQDESNLLITIYDIQTASDLGIRGDGCEISRFVREAAADAVFDEMMSSLEIGSTYACPVPIREAVDQPPPQDGSEPLGRVVQGGVLAELGPITLHLPAGREFTLAQGLADPGGTSFGVYDVQTRSGLWLRPDGCEIGRRVSDPAADAVFDEIVATLVASSR